MRALVLLSITAVIAIIYLYVSKSSLENKLRLCQAKNINLTQSLDFQNEALKKMKLQSQNYKNNEEKRNKKIISQIQAIPAPANKDGTTCEEALDYIIKLESL